MQSMSHHPHNDARHVSPHPPLLKYYQSEVQHRRFLSRVFDETAGNYDWIDSMMSFGSGVWYRRDALKRAGLSAGMHHLDVAVGTGAIARSAVDIVGASGSVLGLDPSMGMLQQAVRSARIPVIQGVAERLPLPDASFDFLSMGYALRHVADLKTTFDEYARVLKPGGTLLILEFAQPKSRLGYAAGRFYLNWLVPWLSQVGSGKKQARVLMEYCWETVDNFVPGKSILAALAASGFAGATRRTWFGVFSEYVVRKPG
jgi:demethylmenaquinone methyltransferase / 2-methoxy-6-polyprenyl-1,4-benzoquinol methylase